MSKTRWIIRASSVVLIAGALAFGATEALGRSMGDPCGNDPGELGTCPPFTVQSCQTACDELFGNGPLGDCGPSSDGPCCRCVI